MLESVFEEPPLFYVASELAEIRLAHGLTEAEQFEQRVQRVEQLMTVSFHLGLPYYTRSLALYLMHRFFASKHYSEADHKDQLVILASLSAAMKMSETVKKLKDIYAQFQASVALSDGPPLDRPSSKDVYEIKEQLLPIELLIQEDIRFVEIMDSPYRFLIRMLSELRGKTVLILTLNKFIICLESLKSFSQSTKVPKPLEKLLGMLLRKGTVTVKKSLTERLIKPRSYRIPLCLQYPPHVICFSAIYLASKIEKKTRGVGSQVSLNHETLRLLDCQLDEVLDICIQIVELYKKLELDVASQSTYDRLLEEFDRRRQGDEFVESAESSPARHVTSPIYDESRSTVTQSSDFNPPDSTPRYDTHERSRTMSPPPRHRSGSPDNVEKKNGEGGYFASNWPEGHKDFSRKGDYKRRRESFGNREHRDKYRRHHSHYYNHKRYSNGHSRQRRSEDGNYNRQRSRSRSR